MSNLKPGDIVRDKDSPHCVALIILDDKIGALRAVWISSGRTTDMNISVFENDKILGNITGLQDELVNL